MTIMSHDTFTARHIQDTVFICTWLAWLLKSEDWSHTIRTKKSQSYWSVLNSFHMTIPASQFSQSTTFWTNPLKKQRRPTSPVDETRLWYLVQDSIGPLMPYFQVLDLERISPRPSWVGFITAKSMRSPTAWVSPFDLCTFCCDIENPVQYQW